MMRSAISGENFSSTISRNSVNTMPFMAGSPRGASRYLCRAGCAHASHCITFPAERRDSAAGQLLPQWGAPGRVAYCILAVTHARWLLGPADSVREESLHLGLPVPACERNQHEGHALHIGAPHLRPS